MQVFLFADKLAPLPPLPPLGRPPNPKSAELHRIANDLDAEPGLLFMEYSKLGDMRHCLNRLTREDRDLPPQALWRVFDCLVKACIAMEYPPRLTQAGPPLPSKGDFLAEVVPAGGAAAAATGFRGNVHFDLDPKNGALCPLPSIFPFLLCWRACAEFLKTPSFYLWIRPAPWEQSPEPSSYASAKIPSEYR